ncbi:MAG: nuclear transport factor 2 family protein [Erythrobacter sp.]|nr:nuclear transport factor 2 family protein [Erythrobacter sp.]
MIERWREWIAAFDRAVETGDWDRLEPFLDPEVSYTVSGVPFACSLKGRDRVIAGFAKSIANFDKRFDAREWFGVGVRVFEPDTITGRAMAVYRQSGAPVLQVSAPTVWRFKGDRLVALHDMYDGTEANIQAALVWLSENAPDLDASYE